MLLPDVAAALSPLLASGAPKWIWATLIMAGFVGLTGLTMALARISTRQRPPPARPQDAPGCDDRADR